MQEIENMIYEIRGKQVMLDSDLAKLYKCKNGTKEINQAVKNNINKFPIDFAFVLNNIESKNLLVKIFDQKRNCVEVDIKIQEYLLKREY
ncbi:MAG: ORF6N domain-containing protein [Bacilli bacterium]|nr:ORF6N domain-containing protein [Bacilli bacterium]